MWSSGNAEFSFECCQESLKKFREEAEKLEKSESLQKAREKYVSFPAVLHCVLQNVCLCLVSICGSFADHLLT